MFDFLLACVGIALGQLSAQIRLGSTVLFGFVFSQLGTGCDGRVVSGVVPRSAVIRNSAPCTHREQHGQHGAD
jgi:hypothetical protein